MMIMLSLASKAKELKEWKSIERPRDNQIRSLLKSNTCMYIIIRCCLNQRMKFIIISD